VLSEIQSELQREEELTNDDTKRRSREVSTKARANNASSSAPPNQSDKKQPSKTGGLSNAKKPRDDSELICVGCNLKGHRLRNCKTTSATDRRRLIDQMDLERAKRKATQKANSANSTENPTPQSANNAEHYPTHYAYVAKTRNSKNRNAKAESNRFYAVNPSPTRVVVYEEDVIIDSGATEHMTGNADSLDQSYPYYSNVTTADGFTVAVTTAGTMRIQCECIKTNAKYNIPLLNTLYVPGFKVNLWSVSSFNASGHVIVFTRESVHIIMHQGTQHEFTIYVRHPYHRTRTGVEHVTVKIRIA
jgi:hypothetical protein